MLAASKKSTLSSSSSLVETAEQTPAPRSCLDLETSKVRFSQTDKEYIVLARHSYSERERRHCWYTEEEKEKYRKRHIRSAERLENKERSKHGESFRGLDGWTQDGGQEANEMVYDCVLSVLREQELLSWKELEENPERLALVSQSKSMRSVRLAIRAAKKDTVEAVKAYRSMEIESIDFGSSDVAVSSLISSLSAVDSRAGTQSTPPAYNPERRRSTSRRLSSFARDSDNESQESREAQEKKEKRRPSSSRSRSSSSSRSTRRSATSRTSSHRRSSRDVGAATLKVAMQGMAME